MPKAKIKNYQTAKATIEINRSVCISCALCNTLAPSTFELDEEMISSVQPDSKDSLNVIVSAAENCSVEAITVTDKKTGKRLWPKG